MKNTQINFIFILIFLIFTSCQQNNENVKTSYAIPTVNTYSKIFVLRIGHIQGETHPRHISLLAFKKNVEQKTNGNVLVEIFPAGQLGTEKEMMNSLKKGELQGFRGGELEEVKKLSILSLPFLCENYAQVNNLLSSDFVKQLCDQKNYELLILGIGNAGGFRQFSNNVYTIKTPNDFVGLKIGTNGMDIVDKTLETFGATTVYTPYLELYSNLKSGFVDGQENSSTNIQSMRFYEVQKYFTIINYQFQPEPFYVNLEWCNSLPPSYQIILKEASTEMMILNNKLISENEANAIKVIENNAKIYYPTEQEINSFKEAVAPVYDYYLQNGILSQAELDEMKEIIKNTNSLLK